MKKLLLSFLLLAIPVIIINAQSDFRPGYLVLTSGDTLRGEIDLRTNAVMSKICSYRAAKESEIKNFSPDDVSEFRMDNGKYFQSHNFPDKGNVFLEYLVNGKLSLYLCEADNIETFYVRKEGGDFIELPKEKPTTVINGVTYKKEPVILKGMLESATQEAPELKNKIQATETFNQKELVNIAVDYHNAVCSDQSCIVYRKSMPGVKVSFQPIVGISLFSTTDKIAPQYGLFLNFWQPLENERLYIKTGFVFGSYHYKDETPGTMVKIPAQVRFLLPARSIRPEISFGPQLYLATYGKEGSVYHTFNLTGAVNIRLSKEKLYLTAGAGIDTSPLYILFSKEHDFIAVSYSAFTGLYFKF